MAGILAAWVVQTGRERLLEPSIGNGALLRAAIDCADRKFSSCASLQLIGCDLDRDAIDYVHGWLKPAHTLLLSDFLAIEPAQVGLVQGVISNPPFTRNHALPKSRREELRRRFGTTGAAGLWVAFIFHSLNFLTLGGRLAAIVPGSATFTTYGREALKRVCKQFSHVEIRQIVDKPLWSSHADERGAIVLAGGYGLGTCDLPKATRWTALGAKLADISDETPASFCDALDKATPLSKIATLSIGTVTGHNKAFLLSDAERSAANIDIDDLTLVVARARHVLGLQITTSELRSLGQEGERTWMLTPLDIAKTRSGVRMRLATIPAAKRRSVVWLNKRSPWWKVNTGRSCDAIFTYMNDRGPRIVVATDGVRCTNTLHQIRFCKQTTANERMVYALSMISSFGQLAAERIGRVYGGGVLKFELTDARKFPVLTGRRVGAKLAFQKADCAVREGDFVRATEIADSLLLPAIFGPSWRVAAAEMSAETLELRAIRHMRSGS